MMSPLIQDTIKAAVNVATTNIKATVVDPMVKSNEELQKLMKEQTETVTSQKTITDQQNALIDEQNNLLEDKAARIERLECDAQYMMMEMDALMDTINNLEQYGRRNSIRLNNFKLR